MKGKPSCHRCVSTGRRCDDYTLWTGNRTVKQTKNAMPHDVTIPHLISALCRSASVEEKQYLDWFKIRTVTKLPGSFMSEFWSMLLLQASVTQPAIMHASLALSAVHKLDATDVRPEDRPLMAQFAVRNYVEALGYLKAHFRKMDMESCQVILIACVVFVSLECLRGHIASTQAALAARKVAELEGGGVSMIALTCQNLI
ncbi:hypothetical protein N7468_000410 [Penicillium chermesinum]|uniref:Zn(2)-C6 fungal-type domain-containing protein n=1 Tax=Penicillium chermesinum TaxID=63820 RepID=A0A9W9TYT8_9EURO|nr:uncharacterized protein N7468_000410 [Penicillium chermesinum]KAJ5248959.1 hypothetical protein N7468_000410 [Penicillium chermesinum]